MPHARLVSPVRGTLEFRRAQTDEYTREAVANVTAEIGVDRPPLVHTETREATRQIRGRVAAPGRARSDPATDDWRQALANYADRLESHVDEFQGTGYTFEDDILDIDRQAVLESVAWEFQRGQPYQLQFDATVRIGRGTFEERDIQRRDPTVTESMDVMLRIDGVDCPGLRLYQMNRSVGAEVNPVFGRQDAENNDVTFTEGVQQTIVFEGTHTGPRADRRAADAALDALSGTKENVTCETQFPGYTLEGFVTAYDSNFEAQFGTGRHNYRLQFTEGERA